MGKICSKCNLEKDEFSKNSNWCRECVRECSKKFYLKNKERINLKHLEKSKERSEFISEIKSKLKCSQCGENHPATLDFHHLNPKEKVFNIGHHVTNNKETILKEIEKCIVLCANCHRKLHHYEKSMET